MLPGAPGTDRRLLCRHLDQGLQVSSGRDPSRRRGQLGEVEVRFSEVNVNWLRWGSKSVWRLDELDCFWFRRKSTRK